MKITCAWRSGENGTLDEHRLSHLHRGCSTHLWDLGAKIEVLLWILQEVDEFHDFNFGLFAASDISTNESSR